MMEIGVNTEIENLADSDSKSVPEGPEGAGASQTSSSTAMNRTVIGRYRILRLVGEGGMGAVYEAEQDHLRRTVALKIIKPGLASPELLRRFEQESQALGRLQHPGIARIYDAGTADTGFGPQPYFAMELIRGCTLGDYVRERNLNVPEKLELVAKVADAVHHAHQRGLIHRDLKPANILVDDTGQPKVLDFGVARVTDRGAPSTVQTDVGQIVGTLAYISPEQVLGDPLEIDTRSDVYALGVMLYELLAGRQPYNIGTMLHEAIQVIREEDPVRLSVVDRSYRGDIEIIAAKALEKDKGRRYASAAELASDIRRYLKDEPIVARPPSTSYQLQKFARRHKAMVLGIAAVFAVLIAGVVVSTWEASRARRAEQLKNRLNAEKVYLQEEIRSEHNFEKIVGSAPTLLEALDQVERVSQTDATVLIIGETGTGKELFARAIHSRSARKERPLVKVNCGAIAAGLVESELFGHVKGAFTGALQNRVGRFELANGGTIFLDEVGELLPETQVKLLRVLQEQEFEPVGSNRTIRVNVRVIAATNRNLEEAVKEGRFRADLYYRLNVDPVRVPPLRERRSDIPQLVPFFVQRFAKKFAKKVDGVSRETMERLTRYPWNGNVRELQNVIERAVVLSERPSSHA
jgi:transcriptional regulator with AAA-type ATPase domain